MRCNRRRLLFYAATLPLLATQTNAQTLHTVRITGDGFVPAELIIEAGDQVTWVNETDADHSVWNMIDDLFDTGPLEPGESAGFTFNAPGTYGYQSRECAALQGTLIVQ